MKFLKIFLPVFAPICIYYILMSVYIYPAGSPISLRALASLKYMATLKNLEVDYLVIGDSTAAYGINPIELTKKSASISMLASSVYTTYKNLESLGHIKINKGILLTQTFNKNHYDIDIWGYFVPNKIYSLNDVITIFCLEKNPKCTLFEKLELDLKYLLARTYLTTYAIDEARERLNDWKRSYVGLDKNYLQVLKDNKGYFKKEKTVLLDKELFLAPFREQLSMPIKNVPVAEKVYLNKIINYAKARHIPLYYVMMPTAAYLLHKTDAIAPYRQSLKEHLKNELGTDLVLIDTQQVEKDFKLDDFWDFCHLNYEGAKKIGSFLRSELHITD